MQISKARMFLTYKTCWLSIIYIICLNYNTSIISRQLFFDLAAFINIIQVWHSMSKDFSLALRTSSNISFRTLSLPTQKAPQRSDRCALQKPSPSPRWGIIYILSMLLHFLPLFQSSRPRSLQRKATAKNIIHIVNNHKCVRVYFLTNTANLS